MRRMSVLLSVGVLAWVCFAVSSCCMMHKKGEEHPKEHPTEQGAWGGGDVMLAAAEHPEHPAEHRREHPGEKPSAEHPAAAKPKPEAKPLTKEQMADAITAYIDKDTKLKGGYFLYYDKVTDKVLVLTLDKVHRDRVAHTGGDVYFACSDFASRSKPVPAGAAMRAKDGVVYDLDFWMKRTVRGRRSKLEVTQVMVHKVAGKPRYTWQEKDGVWTATPVK